MIYSAQQSCLLMSLYARSLDTLPAPDTHTGEWQNDLIRNLRSSLREDMLKSCSRAARCLKESREALGVKMATPFMCYQAAQLILVLLNDTKLHPPPATPTLLRRHGNLSETNGTSMPTVGSFTDHSFALEEGFRHLLGSGMHVPITRGLTRMAYFTAKELQVQLPDTVKSAVEIMTRDLWQTGDCWMFSSIYPNWALPERTSHKLPHSLETCVRLWDNQTWGEDPIHPANDRSTRLDRST